MIYEMRGTCLSAAGQERAVWYGLDPARVRRADPVALHLRFDKQRWVSGCD